MNKFPWNEDTSKIRFWDHERADVIFKVTTLKDLLAHYNGASTEDLVRECARGVAMVMEQIEKMEQK